MQGPVSQSQVLREPPAAGRSPSIQNKASESRESENGSHTLRLHSRRLPWKISAHERLHNAQDQHADLRLSQAQSSSSLSLSLRRWDALGAQQSSQRPSCTNASHNHSDPELREAARRGEDQGRRNQSPLEDGIPCIGCQPRASNTCSTDTRKRKPSRQRQSTQRPSCRRIRL